MRNAGEFITTIVFMLFVLTMVVFWVGNIVGTIRGDINTWLGVIGVLFAPLGWVMGGMYLL